MKYPQVKRLISKTRGRENKNFKYAFWLGYTLGVADTLTIEKKESTLKSILSKKGKIMD